MSLIAIAITSQALLNQAKNLAQSTGLTITNLDNKKFPYLLVITENHLEIRATKKFKPIYIDFTKINWQRYQTTQLCTKAVGIKKNQPLTVLDVTAGFGTDAFILANFGAKVQMLERSSIIGSLLQDALKRHPTQQLNLIITDANHYLKHLTNFPDVIYLDPMYPQRGSALNKKEMRILRDLVGDDHDADQLFNLALKRAKKRVVVKRPRLAPTITNLKPDIIFSGKSMRFDVYLKTQLGIKN